MKRTVLIVDDNDANRYLLRNLLEGEGFAAAEAANGREALEKAQADPPDLIVSDILMPVMDGYVLCRQCKADDRLRQIPFVFYTATYTEPKDERFALSLGADRFVIKPQEPEVMIRILKEVWEERSAAGPAALRPLGDEMDFSGQYHEILFHKLEKKMVDLEVAHRKLQCLEEQYRLSFENVTDIVWTVDVNLTVLKMSPSVERMLGYGPQDFIGRSVSDLATILAPDSIERAVAEIRSVLKGKTIPASVFPLVAKDGTVRYGEASGSPILRDGEIVGMVSIIRDITERKRTEEALFSTTKRLMRTLDSTVRAISTIVEVRDPYTAGHQRRVAELAKAIAAEMGFSADRTDFVNMAANIHDIGKIAVPAEILSVPRQLTAAEFSLIKLHPAQGYDILKDIEFPWPIAAVILQHHERLDGSGYPDGLKKEAILLEARIIAVADVVESMASYRPYRPALGIEAALDEIAQNRGNLYDPDVVDACARLFKQKNYRLL